MENSGKIERSAGILMHISSLPSPFGIGTLGKTAYEFVDFVAQARHRYWQVLPLGPTTYGDSPYQSYSAFAGNPYFVDLEMLTDDGILDRNIYEDIDWGSGDYVDYEKVYNNRFTVLHEAYKNYRQKLSESRVKLAAGLPEYKKFDNFNKTNAYWLDDYALFMALKWHFNQKSWQDWDEDIKFRTQKGIQKYKELLADEIGFWKFVQYEFDKQWKKQAADDEEVSMLEVFSFPKTKEQMAWKEIKDHADKEGITVFQPDDSHSPHAICYDKTVFLKEQKASNIFLLFSKLFILITLLISGAFIMVVKNLAEMSSYQRRYEFFHSMGMKQKEQKKILSFEICSVANIALGTGICLALLYVMTYLHWYDAIGEKISTTFWSYWLKLVGIYIIIQIVVQKLFVRYVNKRI